MMLTLTFTKVTTIWFFLGALWPCIEAQQQKPSYVVVAPKVIRPNTDYMVSVSVFNLNKEGQTNKGQSVTSTSLT